MLIQQRNMVHLDANLRGDDRLTFLRSEGVLQGCMHGRRKDAWPILLGYRYGMICIDMYSIGVHIL